MLRKFPGPQNDAAILGEFCASGAGYVSALDTSRLRALQSMRPGESSAEILEFGRLVAVFARLAGTEPLALASDALLESAVASAASQVPAVSPFHATRNFPGLHRRLVETLGLLADWGLGTEELDALAGECREPLSGKLRSLSQIRSAVEVTLSDLGRQTNDQHIRLCLESDPAQPVSFPPALVYFGDVVEPKHVEWLRWAASRGATVTVVVDAAPRDPSMFPVGTKIASAIGEVGIPFGAPSRLATCLFADAVDPDQPLSLEGLRSADLLAEAEWALRACFEKSPNDLAKCGIFARNLEAYAPLLESAAQRLQIPVSLAGRAPLRANGFIRVLFLILDALTANDVRKLGAGVGSSYFGLRKEDRKQLEDGLLTCHREGDRQWLRLESWAAEKAETWPWLVLLLQWRKSATSGPLEPAEWRSRLADLVACFPSLEKGGYSIERDIRAKNSLESELAAEVSIQNLQPELRWGFVDFVSQLGLLADRGESTLPSNPNGIQVSESGSGFGELDHLVLLGMLEGTFPRRRTEDPILTDEDRREISNRRSLMFPLPDSFDNSRRERDEFVRLCSVPRQSLTVSYPETADDRDTIPAFYLKELERASGKELPWRRFPRRLLAPDAGSISLPADRILREALDGESTLPISIEPLSDEVRSRLEATLPKALTLRELRMAFECPFRHFTEQRLHLYPERDRRRWYQLRSLPQKARLNLQPDEDAARRALHGALETQLDEMTPHVASGELKLLRQGGLRMIDEWIEREFSARKVWPKDEGSVRTNIAFGSNDLKGELPRVGAVEGSVAGISMMGGYKVVHLMESSPPKLDKAEPLGLKPRDLLYYGGHLMASYEKGKTPALEVESMSGGRRLVVMNRREDTPLESSVEEGLEILNLSGSADSTSVSEVFFRQVKDLLEQAGKAIRAVDLRATNGDHCEFCDYGELCRNSQVFGEQESPFEDGDD